MSNTDKRWFNNRRFCLQCASVGVMMPAEEYVGDYDSYNGEMLHASEHELPVSTSRCGHGHVPCVSICVEDAIDIVKLATGRITTIDRREQP